MVFWVLAAIITFIATLCAVLPLARAKGSAIPQLDFDKALYQSRIEEIKRDQELGRISQDQSEAAIAAEGRKLISLSKQLETSQKTKTKNALFETQQKRHKILQLISIAIIPACALGLYLSIGSPTVPDQSLASRLSADPQNLSFEEIIAKAEAHLVKSPNDIRGWAVIAPAYSRIGRLEDAVNAWSNVKRLDPNFPEVNSFIAEVIMETTNGEVTPQVNALLVEEIIKNPASARARYYLSLELSQKNDFEGAAKSWHVLVEGANPQAPWLETAQEYRDAALENLNLEISDLSKITNPLDEYTSQSVSAGQSAPGPTHEQMRDAQNLSVQDRQAMIQSMVSGLNERLKEDPSDKEGWKRLIRAYGVLGEQENLSTAFEQASKAHANDAGFIKEIESMKNTIAN